jgi:putative phage-type endonuclease
MPITEEQRLRRRDHIGASDIAAINGLSKWANRYDIWAFKTRRYDGDKSSKPKDAGNYFEPAVLDWAESGYGLGPIERDPKKLTVPYKEWPVIESNLDGILISTGEPVEAKTTDLFFPSNEVWGDEETDEIPDRVILQGQTQMICTETDMCYVPAFIGGRGFTMYRVKRNKDVIDMILENAHDFWENHVLKDIPPDEIPSMAIIKKMRREPKSVTIISDDLVREWLTAKEKHLIAKKEFQEAQRRMLGTFGDAEAGECGLGTVTYFTTKQKGYTVEPTEFRTPRFKAKGA